MAWINGFISRSIVVYAWMFIGLKAKTTFCFASACAVSNKRKYCGAVHKGIRLHGVFHI